MLRSVSAVCVCWQHPSKVAPNVVSTWFQLTCYATPPPSVPAQPPSVDNFTQPLFATTFVFHHFVWCTFCGLSKGVGVGRVCPLWKWAGGSRLSGIIIYGNFCAFMTFEQKGHRKPNICGNISKGKQCALCEQTCATNCGRRRFTYILYIFF